MVNYATKTKSALAAVGFVVAALSPNFSAQADEAGTKIAAANTNTTETVALTQPKAHSFYNGMVVTNAQAKEATKYFDAVILYGSDIRRLDSMRSNLAEEDGIKIITLKTENPNVADCAIVLVNDGKGLDPKSGFNQREIDRSVIDNYTINRVRSQDSSPYNGICLDKVLS